MSRPRAGRSGTAVEPVVVGAHDARTIGQLRRCLDDMLARHAGTVRVLHRLRPFGAVMAGTEEFDPYKG